VTKSDVHPDCPLFLAITVPQLTFTPQMGNCFSSHKDTDTHNYTVSQPQSDNNNANDGIPAASSAGAGFFTGAQNFAITGGQLIEIHGDYVCGYCSCAAVTIVMMILSIPIIPQLFQLM